MHFKALAAELETRAAWRREARLSFSFPLVRDDAGGFGNAHLADAQETITNQDAVARCRFRAEPALRLLRRCFTLLLALLLFTLSVEVCLIATTRFCHPFIGVEIEAVDDLGRMMRQIRRAIPRKPLPAADGVDPAWRRPPWRLRLRRRQPSAASPHVLAHV